MRMVTLIAPETGKFAAMLVEKAAASKVTHLVAVAVNGCTILSVAVSLDKKIAPVGALPKKVESETQTEPTAADAPILSLAVRSCSPNQQAEIDKETAPEAGTFTA